jgi:hypothetical protein
MHMTTLVLTIIAQAWISLGMGLWFFRIVASPPTRWHSRYDEPGWGAVLSVFLLLAVALAPLLAYCFVATKARGN